MQSELAQAAALLAAEFPDAPRSMLESALRENDLDIPSARRRLLEMLEQEKRGASGAYSSSRVRPGCWINQKDGRLASSSIQPAHTALPPPAAALRSPADSHALAPRLLPLTILFYFLLQASEPVESPTSPSSSSWFTTAGWNQVGGGGGAASSTLLPLSLWPLAPCSA